YGATNPVFTTSYSGFVNGETTNVLSGTPALSTSATTNSGVGGYVITAAQGSLSTPNYLFSFVNGTLTVGATPLLVAGNNASRAYGATNPVFTASYVGFVNGEGTNAMGGTLLLSTTADTNSPVGTYPIVPGGLTSTNYAIAYTNGTLTVSAYVLS